MPLVRGWPPLSLILTLHLPEQLLAELVEFFLSVPLTVFVGLLQSECAAVYLPRLHDLFRR